MCLNPAVVVYTVWTDSNLYCKIQQLWWQTGAVIMVLDLSFARSRKLVCSSLYSVNSDGRCFDCLSYMAQNSMLLKSAQNVSQYQWWVMYGQQQWECDCGQVVNMYVLPGFAEVTRVCSNVAERNFNVNCCKSWNLWMKELLLLYWVCTLLLVKVCRVLTLRLSLLLAFAVLWNAPSNITAASWSPVLWLAVMYPYVYIRTFRVQ